METDQAEQLNVLLNQSTRVLNRNCDTKERDATMTSRWDNGSLPPFKNKDTQSEIVMAEKKDTESTSSKYQLPMTNVCKYIIMPQKVAATVLETSEEQVQKGSISPDQGGFNPHPARGCDSLLYFPTVTFW